MPYLFKCYRRSAPSVARAGELVASHPIEALTDQAAIAAIQPLLKELRAEHDFANLEDGTGYIVAYWGSHA